YESSPGIGPYLVSTADAEADMMPAFFGGRGPDRGPERKGGRARGSEPPRLRGRGPRSGDSGFPGLWRIAIRHHEGSLQAIVEQVLLLARGRAANAEKRLVSPGDLIQRSLRSSMAGSDPPPCTVECRIEPNLPAVFCDEQAMTQALRNLIDNAVKYGLVGGW